MTQVNHNTTAGAEYWQIYAKIRTYSSSRSSKSDDFGTNRKRICEFLLVINSNFGPILHRFWDTTTYWLKIAYFSYPSLIWRPRSLSSPWNFAVKLGVRKLESWGYTAVNTEADTLLDNNLTNCTLVQLVGDVYVNTQNLLMTSKSDRVSAPCINLNYHIYAITKSG